MKTPRPSYKTGLPGRPWAAALVLAVLWLALPAQSWTGRSPRPSGEGRRPPQVPGRGHRLHFPAVAKDWAAAVGGAPGGVLLISEILYDPAGPEPDGEWMEVYNAGRTSIALADYKLGDEETRGGGEGMLQFPPGATLAPGEAAVIAYRASAFLAGYGLSPDYEIKESDPGVPNLVKYAPWSGGNVELVNSGDEVLLLDGQDRVADAVSWGQSFFAFDPPVRSVRPGYSLERAPADGDSDAASDWRPQSSPAPGRVDLNSPTPAPSASPTASPPGGTPTPGPSPTPLASGLYLSEVLYDPVGSEPGGEWLEIYNATGRALPLDGYKVGDEETAGGGEGMYAFPAGWNLQPGQVLVVANRAADFQPIFGFLPDFELVDSDPIVPDLSKHTPWAGGVVSLGNSGDEALLLDGADRLVDAVSWGNSRFAFDPPAPDVPEGRSLERVPADVDRDIALDWREQPLPDPGQVRFQLPMPTPTPTATGTPGTTATPTASATPGPSASPTATPSPAPSSTPGPSPTASQTPLPVAHLLISEVFYDSPGTDSQEEWVEIANPTGVQVDLSGYKVGDEETQGGGEGMYQFPAGATIAAGEKVVVALQAAGFASRVGFNPDYELSNTDPGVPDLAPYAAWSGGGMALGNSGDEVLLLDAADLPVDVVSYESGAYTGVVPHPGVASGHSLERSPSGQDTDDCSLDFIDQTLPTPGF